MKKSFYELYLERQMQKNKPNIVEQEMPKIRSPNKMKIAISYYFRQLLKLVIIIVIFILSSIGTMVITNEYLRNEFIKLLFMK